jgi:hypothetical protein
MSKEFKEIKENSEAKRGLGWRPNGAMAGDYVAHFFLPTVVPCARHPAPGTAPPTPDFVGLLNLSYSSTKNAVIYP